MEPFCQTFKARSNMKRLPDGRVALVLESFHGTPAIVTGDWTELGLFPDAKYFTFPSVAIAQAALAVWDGTTGDPLEGRKA